MSQTEPQTFLQKRVEQVGKIDMCDLGPMFLTENVCGADIS